MTKPCIEHLNKVIQKRMRSLREQGGYTLIELALVLVVVALFLGGVFVGGSAVLENARTATLLGQIKDLAAASREFKARYGYFPGDLPNAASLITADGGVSAGCSYAAGGNAGNGIVDTATESRCALEHAVKSRMLSKVELNGTNYRITHPFGGGEVSLWHTAGNENAVRVTNVPCTIALRVDDKFDNASSMPFLLGLVVAFDTAGAAIRGCTVGGAHDPVPVLLVRY